MPHLVNHVRKPYLINDNTLHVVGVISNYVRWNSRYRLYRKWLEALESTPNVKVYTVETAYGDRNYEVTQADNPNHLQLRTNSEIWCKESTLNLGVRHLLPRNWKYMAWTDCDVFFRDKNWALETIHQLQHFEVVQPWSDCLDLGFKGNVMKHFKSFGYLQQQGVRMQKCAQEPYQYGHTGYAFACTRKFYERVEGLLDFAILGSGDAHMAWAMIGEAKHSVHAKMSDGYKRMIGNWERKATRACNKQVGFVHGRIEHEFHGAKKNRFYRTRWNILVDHKYNPEEDIYHDEQGLVQLEGKPALEHDIHLYNLSRDEDGTCEG